MNGAQSENLPHFMAEPWVNLGSERTTDGTRKHELCEIWAVHSYMNMTSKVNRQAGL